MGVPEYGLALAVPSSPGAKPPRINAEQKKELTTHRNSGRELRWNVRVKK